MGFAKIFYVYIKTSRTAGGQLHSNSPVMRSLNILRIFACKLKSLRK